MHSFLLLLAFLHHAHVPVARVSIPGPDGVVLEAALVRPPPGTVIPEGAARPVGVVELHGCGGPFARRDGQWAVALAKAGHVVLLPDSFGSRGVGGQCHVHHRVATPNGLRRADAIAAGRWLQAQPGVPAGGVALIGFSNGASTTLATANAARKIDPPGLFSRFVGFYPGCRARLDTPHWAPSGPMLILVGAKDDWTPAAPCRALAARFPDRIRLIVYPGAWHDFDAPRDPVHVMTDLSETPGNVGHAHAGNNPAAQADALQQVPAFLALRGEALQ
ncbi:MAG: dienelactone hydrolase family protein [Rhodospirillales bacterium]|nr:dienelactone hydrolase family protein [Rhodospirillales bacterium]